MFFLDQMTDRLTMLEDLHSLSEWHSMEKRRPKDGEVVVCLLKSKVKNDFVCLARFRGVEWAEPFMPVPNDRLGESITVLYWSSLFPVPDDWLKQVDH